MIDFASASTRAVNARRGVLECLELAYDGGPATPSLLLVNAAVGHDLTALSHELKAECPDARVLAASCAGVVGREGPGESIHDMAIMGLSGEGFTIAHVDGLFGHTSFSKGVELGQDRKSVV